MSRRQRQAQITQLMDVARQQHIAGDLASAEAGFREILTSSPNDPEALHRLGMIMESRGDLVTGVHYMQRSLGLAPQVPEFHINLGEAYRKLGRNTEATECFLAAIRYRPTYAEAYNNLALALGELSAADAALEAALTAVHLAPSMACLQVTKGWALYNLRRYPEAIAAYSEALRLQRDMEQAIYGLLTVRAAQGIPLDELLAGLPPNLPQFTVLTTVAVGYLSAHRFEEAEPVLLRALELDPQHAVLLNLGNLYTAKRELDRAETYLRRAVELQATPRAQLNLGICLLTMGKLAEGWAGYEYRNRPNRPTDGGAERPQWRGEPCEGKTIVLRQEQGYGDSIQFVRYAPLLAARGARVVVQVHAQLAELMSTVQGVSQVLTDQPPRNFAAYCHMASLPYAFGTTLENVPADVPYIKVDPARVAVWQQRLADASGKLRVGLVWQGNPAHQSDHIRSIGLAALAPLAEVPNVQLYSLQLGHGREQIGTPGTPAMVDLSAHVKSFVDTAAAMMVLDLVIGIDSAVIHLAGALARPVWSLHAFCADFRWLTGRTDSPWYPTMRLYRQTRLKDWQGVVGGVVADLAELAAKRRPCAIG